MKLVVNPPTLRRAAVLKSQGPENWPRGRPAPLWVRKNRALSGENRAGKPGRKKNRWWGGAMGGVMWRRRSGVLEVVCGILFFFFVRKWRLEWELLL